MIKISEWGLGVEEWGKKGNKRYFEERADKKLVTA